MKGVCILIAVAVLAAIPLMLWAAEDGAALYEAKCSMCHGAKGDAMADTKLADTAMTVEQLVAYLTKGDKEKSFHASPVADLNEAQAKAVAEHVKSLKK